MPEQDPATPQPGPDGLWRWLLGGLAAGGIMLGLLVAAYAVGYHRGQDHPHAAAASTAPAPVTAPAATTSAATTTPTPDAAPVEATPALVARGKTLFGADGCSGC